MQNPRRRRASATASARAYSPSHLTGFFEIRDDDKNPLQKGSVGGGILLEAGCETCATLSSATLSSATLSSATLSSATLTEAALSSSTKNRAGRKIREIRINGVAVAEAETTKSVVERLVGDKPVSVATDFEVPVGCGFGASGAGALSTALALNDLFSLGRTLNELVFVAHLAEVENSTGLGDVVAEAYGGGGVVLRKEPGVVGGGRIEKIPHSREKVSYVVFGRKSTRSVLLEELEDGSANLRRRINEAGRAAMKELARVRQPSLENFMLVSRRFSLRCGVVSERCRDAIEAVAAEGKVASAAMLGDAVFLVGESEALKEFGEVRTSRIAESGAKVRRSGGQEVRRSGGQEVR